MRLFVALALPDPVKLAIFDWQEQTLQTLPMLGLRPVGPESLHLTLCFLGERPQTDLPAIERACQEVSQRHAPELSLGPPCWLPSRRKARVLVIEVHDPRGTLTDIQLALSESLSAADVYVAEKRSFLAHVTVARARSAVRAPAGLETHVAAESFRADQLALFRSRAGAGGARYERIARWELPQRR